MAIKLSPNLHGLLLRMLMILVIIFSYGSYSITAQPFEYKETTILKIREAFVEKRVTSRQLVEYYMKETKRLNPTLRAVIEVNPDALSQADKADAERKTKPISSLSYLHGIPIILKDTFATKDKQNTTVGSFALLGSVVPRDAAVVTKLRKAGAIIFGKANMNEWSSFRSTKAPNGWSARGGFGKNPYVLSADTGGSSSGSATAVAANMVTVSLGTDANGSVIFPANQQSAVGIRPTPGLVSNDGVIIVTFNQTTGPICRTMSDAVYVLDVIVGNGTDNPSKNIPLGGYKQYLRLNGLTGKRLGIVREPYSELINDSYVIGVFDKHVQTLRELGADIIDNLTIANISAISDAENSGEKELYLAQFKIVLNNYLKNLSVSPVRSLADVIAFNKKNAELEMLPQYGQDLMLQAQETNGIGDREKAARDNLARLSKDGFEKLIKDNKLDAVVTPGSSIFHVLAIGDYPGIGVPAGYDKKGVPFGITFSGIKFSEPKLIYIAYNFEQKTKIRKPPSFKP